MNAFCHGTPEPGVYFLPAGHYEASATENVSSVSTCECEMNLGDFFHRPASKCALHSVPIA
jgi:hypothetical protein